LAGVNVVAGSIAGSLTAALLIGALGAKAKDRNSIIAVLMPFGLGLGILALSMYQGRAANKFGLLTGQIVAVDDPQLLWLVGISAAVLIVLALIWRPLSFASLDPDVAAARGVPTRTLSIVFMLLLGLSVAASVQVVGALLVLSLLVTPAAAAIRVTTSPALAVTLSVIFAVVSVVGGIILAVGGGLPVSPYVTTVSFLIYLTCRIIEGARNRARGAK
jgi:zinc/manganese transport system permease protein